MVGHERPLRWFSRLWAFIVSLIFAGMGQALRGAYRRACGFAAASIASVLLFLVLPYLWSGKPSSAIGVLVIASELVILTVMAAGAIDAARFCRNRASRRRVWWQRWLIYGALIVALNIPNLPQLAPNDLHWRSFSIPSTSMEPTLLPGDYILVVDGYYRDHPPQRGDLVVFNLPCEYPQLDAALAAQFRKSCDTSVAFIKRIVGLPGDHIQMKRGILIVNDTSPARQADGSYRFAEGVKPETWQKYRESLSPEIGYEIVVKGEDEPLENTDPVTVPADRYFMIGDNRDNSADSRDPTSGIAYVPRQNLIGRPVIVQFSSTGARSWEAWKWPTAIRWERIGQSLR